MKTNVKMLRFMSGSTGREPNAQSISVRFNGKDGGKRIVVRAVKGSKSLNSDLLSELESKINDSIREVPSDEEIKKGKKAKAGARRKRSK